MAKTIEDLRTHLFDTLQTLKTSSDPKDLEKARVVADVGRVVIESAKVEVQFLQVTGALKSTGFLPDGDEKPELKPQLQAVNARR